MQEKAKQIGPGVFYLSPRPPVTELYGCQSLIAAASEPMLAGKSRLCTHKDPDSALHEMMIVHEKAAYVRPHRHINKEESIHVIDGYADFILFDPTGVASSVTRIGPYKTNKCWYMRINESVYHMLIVRSKHILFHEVTTGPLNPAQTEFADWSPEIKDIAGQAIFRKALNQQLKPLRTKLP